MSLHRLCCCCGNCASCTVTSRPCGVRIIVSGVTPCFPYNNVNGTYDFSFSGSDCEVSYDIGPSGNLSLRFTAYITFASGTLTFGIVGGVLDWFAKYTASHGGDCQALLDATYANANTSCSGGNAGYGGTIEIITL